MKFFFSAIIFFLSGTLFSHAENTPQRIISLSPNATTILVDLGVRGELVGITRYCTPPSGISPTVIGGFIDPSAETILALKPGVLVRAHTGEKSFVERMRRCGISVLLLNPEGYENTKKDVELLGKTLGKEARAREILASWSAAESRIAEDLRACPLPAKPKTLVRWGEVFVGKKSYLNTALELCGAENCVPESARAWPVLSKENIIATGAELLICVTPDGPVALTLSPALAKRLATVPEYSRLPAVVRGNVWEIREGQSLYPASRLYEFLPALAGAIRASAK